MKYLMAAALIALSVTEHSEANAAVYCAVGVYHAGCVRRPVVAVVAPVRRAVVVAPRRVVVAPRAHVRRF